MRRHHSMLPAIITSSSAVASVEAMAAEVYSVCPFGMTVSSALSQDAELLEKKN